MTAGHNTLYSIPCPTNRLFVLWQRIHHPVSFQGSSQNGALQWHSSGSEREWMVSLVPPGHCVEAGSAAYILIAHNTC